MWVVFGFQAVLALVVVTLFLRTYASWKTVPWYAYIVTAAGWFIAMVPVFLVPADISQAIANDTDVDRFVLFYVWKVVYWIAFFLTWLACPLLQDYVDSGGFTFCQRFKTAIIINAVFYGCAGLVVVGFVIYLAVAQQFGKEEFLTLAASLGNAVGLCLLLLLLGFGLVDMPRRLWRSANYAMMLRQLQFDATKLAERTDDARIEHSEALEEVRQARSEVPFHSPLRIYIDQIVAKCSATELDPPGAALKIRGPAPSPQRKPQMSRVRSFLSMLRIGGRGADTGSDTGNESAFAADDDEESARTRTPAAAAEPVADSREGRAARDIRSKYGLQRPTRPTDPATAPSGGSSSEPEYAGTFDQSRLIKLHERIMRAEASIRREQLYWDELCSRYFGLEDTIAAARDPSHVFHSALYTPNVGRFAAQRDSFDWWWRVWLRPITLRLGATFLGLLSLAIVWSEVMVLFVTPDMSIFSLLVNRSTLPAWAIQILMAIPTVYMVAAAASALFNVRIWKVFQLFRHGQSPPSSLLFSAAYLSRVAAPVSFNLLNLSRLTLTHNTAFQDVLGDFDIVPALGTYFPYYAPACLVMLCILTVFSVGSRLMNALSGCLGKCGPCKDMKTFVFEEGYDDQHIERGRGLLAEARKLAERERGRYTDMVALTQDTTDTSGADDDDYYGTRAAASAAAHTPSRHPASSAVSLRAVAPTPPRAPAPTPPRPGPSPLRPIVVNSNIGKPISFARGLPADIDVERTPGTGGFSSGADSSDGSVVGRMFAARRR